MDLAAFKQTLKQDSPPSGLTPALVRSLPGSVRDPVIAAYADSLTPILGWLVPLFVVATVLACLLEEVPLVHRSPAAH